MNAIEGCQLWMLLALIFFAPLSRSISSSALPPEMLAFAKQLAALTLFSTFLFHVAISRASAPLPKAAKTWLAALVGSYALTAVANGVTADGWIHLASVAGGVSLWWVVHQVPRRWHEPIALSILISAGMVSVIAIIQFLYARFGWLEPIARYLLAGREITYVAESALAIDARPLRVAGTFPHPNYLGMYYAILFPFSAGIALGPARPRLRLAASAALVFMIGGLYASNSRAGMAGAAVSLTFLGFHRGYRRWLAFGTIVIAATAAMAFFQPQLSLKTLDSVVRSGDGLSSRGGIWLNALELVRMEPLIGAGAAQFNTRYFEEFGLFLFDRIDAMPEQIWWFQVLGLDIIRTYHAHNVFLQIAVEHGLIGLSVFGIGAFLAIVQCKKRALSTSEVERPVRIGAAAAVVGFLVAGLFDSHFSLTTLALNLMAGPLLALGTAG